MTIIQTSNVFRIDSGDEVKTYKNLPVGTYKVCFDKGMGFYLEKIYDFIVNEKLYGDFDYKLRKIFQSYNSLDRSLGVILNGEKGMGKTLFAKKIAEHASTNNLPTIIINKDIENIENFLLSIDQECVFLFDEFEKVFSCENGFWDKQDKFLNLFDGFNNKKKIFILTCNNIKDISTYMKNRPGRFHYKFDFVLPSVKEIKEYIKDNVKNITEKDIIYAAVCLNRIQANYDALRAVCFELNQGEKLSNILKILNIGDSSYQKYYLGVVFEDGTIDATHRWVNIDLNNEELGRLEAILTRKNQSIQIKRNNADWVETIYSIYIEFFGKEILYDEEQELYYLNEEDFHGVDYTDYNGYDISPTDIIKVPNKPIRIYFTMDDINFIEKIEKAENNRRKEKC